MNEQANATKVVVIKVKKRLFKIVIVVLLFLLVLATLIIGYLYTHHHKKSPTKASNVPIVAPPVSPNYNHGLGKPQYQVKF